MYSSFEAKPTNSDNHISYFQMLVFKNRKSVECVNETDELPGYHKDIFQNTLRRLNSQVNNKDDDASNYF